MSGVLLSRPLELEARMRTPDGAGGFTETWQGLGLLWSDVRGGSGRGAAGEDVALSRLTLRITVRAAPQGAQSRPVPGQRFRDGARLYAIVAVHEQRGGAFLMCFAHEEVAT
ncbi:head-tail adaptor protein [Oceaniglobus roseus]|uniref:head-tail adaptor protein n=1 Tax=Oceaniglobus roseus TaxID=1737570 RepID=UPI000C7F11D3|nr:head-tail adaptor protein [Kandeliimicrobium roseum]